jgi:hypothetical protein
VVDRGRTLPAWDAPGRRIPSRLRGRLELGGYGWVVMMIVLAVLGGMVIATRRLPPPPHTWQAIVAALAFLAFGLLAIGADMRDGQRTLRLLRLGVVITPDDLRPMVYDPAHPHDRRLLADVPGDVVLGETFVDMRRPISGAFLIAPIACVVMAAALGVLVAVV